MPTTQKRNAAAIDLSSSDFVLSYAAATAWGNVVSNHLMLRHLRGFWPCSSMDQTYAPYDLSGQGRTLSNNGPTTGVYGLVPYMTFVAGSSQYLSRSDEAGLDIGNSGVSDPGLSMMGWFYPTVGSAVQGLMSKWIESTNNRSYRMYISNTGKLVAEISSNGSAIGTTCTSAGSLSLNTWYHLAARWTPSSMLDVFIDGVKTSAVSAVANIYNSSAAFAIGRTNNSNYYSGNGTLFALAAAPLSDATIQAIFHHSRALLGK